MLQNFLSIVTDDDPISDWKLEEKKYQGLQFITSYPKNTGFGIPAIANKREGTLLSIIRIGY